MYSRKKWVDLLAHLNKMTKQDKIKWLSCKGGYIKQVVGIVPLNAFTADYKGREFLIFSFEYSDNIPDYEIVSRSFSGVAKIAESLRDRSFHDKFLFYLKDQDSEEYIQGPKMPAVFDLYSTVYKSKLDLDALLEDLDDETSEVTQNGDT